MRILIDTNVILDVLLKRSPFYETAIEVLKLSARDDIQEFVSASAITDIYYIAYKNLRDKAAVRELDRKSTRLNSSHIEESRMPSSA